MPCPLDTLRDCLRGRACLIGVGNLDCGDDAFGVQLAQKLLEEGKGQRTKDKGGPDLAPVGFAEFGLWTSDFGQRHTVILAGKTPERLIGRVVDGGFEHVIFLDAVEFGGVAGAVVFLDSSQMTARFPQVSTHKISLGLLAKCVEAKGTTRAWLLGVQPESLRSAADLTPAVQNTLNILAEILHNAGRNAPSRVRSRQGGIGAGTLPGVAPVQPAITNRPSPSP